MTTFITKKTISLVIASFLLNILFVLPPQASGYDFNTESGLNAIAKPTGFIEQDTKISEASPVIALVMPLIGVVYLLFLVYAGYVWLIARGNEQNITQAKNIIISATLGVLVILGSYAISVYVISAFQSDFVKE